MGALGVSAYGQGAKEEKFWARGPRVANARMIMSAQRSHSAITAGAHREMRPYGINDREHAGHYDVTIRDVGKFTSVVDEQMPGNGDDTMIINNGHML